MFIEAPDSGIYTLQVVGAAPEGLDMRAALLGLAGLALPRLSNAPVAPVALVTPRPTLEGDAEIEALIPTQIGGADVEIQSMSPNDLAAMGTIPPALQPVLDTIGKTMADVRVGVGFVASSTPETSVNVTAFQVKGSDMASLRAELMPILLESQVIADETAVRIADKDVTRTSGEGRTTYFYPRNDILWVVSAEEPNLTEVFQKLP